MIKYSYSVVDSDSCNFILPHKKIRNLIVENLTLMPLSNFYNESYQVWPWSYHGRIPWYQYTVSQKSHFKIKTLIVLYCTVAMHT